MAEKYAGYVNVMSIEMDYSQRLKDLRESYFKATPQQRMNVAKKRLADQKSGPDFIITYVSAIEGLLRSLVIWNNSYADKPSKSRYNKYKNAGVNGLYLEYLKILSIDPIVPSEVYELVTYSVEYRNLLAHECTYLGQDTYPDLVDACDIFLKAICLTSSVKYS
jgi:hypothetical protein